MLTLSAGTLPYLAHHGTFFSDRCPTTTTLERTIVPMDDLERMPALGAVKPRRQFFDVIHRASLSAQVLAPLHRSWARRMAKALLFLSFEELVIELF